LSRFCQLGKLEVVFLLEELVFQFGRSKHHEEELEDLVELKL
jgi:hypothetical protein